MNCIQRIKKIESLINEFDYVERCYAVQAGREIRVIVSPEKISEYYIALLFHECLTK